ncbi:hypothetical protein [uncultured Mitsuokella sp.]|nr:hypothetical protein [uncultured Mitsuokella sp.]
MFKGYRHLTRKLNRQLAQLGFKLENGKTHYKIYYGEDHQHAVIISKTSSDYRVGMNICRQLYTLVPANP